MYQTAAGFSLVLFHKHSCVKVAHTVLMDYPLSKFYAKSMYISRS
jgi:hypothetical protein